MADTKQATPKQLADEVIAARTAWLESHGVPISFEFARFAEAIGKLTDWASRSGPDRTPDTVEYWKSRATTAELKVLTFHEEIVKLRSGPDRTTQEEVEEDKRARKHTQDWYAGHYGKLQDWARTRLPEPWRTEFFHCVANGLWDPSKDVGEAYMSVGAGRVVPGGYFKMDTAAEQLLRDQTTRAEQAEEKLLQAGPDRGQQDAPDRITELATKYTNRAALKPHMIDDMLLTIDRAWLHGLFQEYGEELLAKAARAGLQDEGAGEMKVQEDGMNDEDLRKLSFREQNEFWRGGRGVSIGSKPHNCREYWALKEFLASTNAPEEIRETLEQFAHFVDTRLSQYAQQLYSRRQPPPLPRPRRLPR